MSASENPTDMDGIEAAAFRRLLEHLRLREDVANVTLMGEAGFCRNCLADWLVEASVRTPRPLTQEEARDMVYGEPYVNWKARQREATTQELSRMQDSLAENERRRKTARSRALDDQLDDSFPASDPPSITQPD